MRYISTASYPGNLFINARLGVLSTLVALATFAGSNALAQSEDDPPGTGLVNKTGVPDEDFKRWPFLGVQIEGEPVIYVKVNVNASRLMTDVRGVQVACLLYSKMLGTADNEQGTLVAEGYAYAHRPAFDVSANVHEDDDGYAEPFEGNAVNTTLPVLFYPASENSPMEMWTNGECQLNVIEEDVGLAFRDPMDCAAQPQSAAQIAAGQPTTFFGDCVWPGTDPASAKMTFQRQGLENAVFERPDVENQVEEGETSDATTQDQGG